MMATYIKLMEIVMLCITSFSYETVAQGTSYVKATTACPLAMQHMQRKLSSLQLMHFAVFSLVFSWLNMQLPNSLEH